MNESNREEPMKEEVSNENNGEHAEAKVEVTYLSLYEDEDFASETISRENLFFIGVNTKYGHAVRFNSRYIT